MKLYTQNEIEAESSRLLNQLKETNPDIDLQDLCAMLLYGASYILYTTTDIEASPYVAQILKDTAYVGYKWLSTPSGKETNASVSESTESSEVQGSN